jgi:hypothetical protein
MEMRVPGVKRELRFINSPDSRDAIRAPFNPLSALDEALGSVYLHPALWNHSSIYAAGHPSLRDVGIPTKILIAEKRCNLIIPTISLLAIVLALLGINWAVLLYFLAPFALILHSRNQ